MRRPITAAAALLLVSGCAPHQWAPGPGRTVADIAPAKANCAAASSQGPGFSAYGSAVGVAAAGLVYAIADGIRAHSAFDTCMQAMGFLVVDDKQTSSVQPVTAENLPAPTQAVAAPPTPDEANREAASWAATQEVLSRPRDSGAAPRLYGTLCKDGDASACMMADALGNTRN